MFVLATFQIYCFGFFLRHFQTFFSAALPHYCLKISPRQLNNIFSAAIPPYSFDNILAPFQNASYPQFNMLLRTFLKTFAKKVFWLHFNIVASRKNLSRTFLSCKTALLLQNWIETLLKLILAVFEHYCFKKTLNRLLRFVWAPIQF